MSHWTGDRRRATRARGVCPVRHCNTADPPRMPSGFRSWLGLQFRRRHAPDVSASKTLEPENHAPHQPRDGRIGRRAHRAGRRAGHVWLSHLATRLVRQTDEPIRQISDEKGAVFGRLHDIYRISQDRGRNEASPQGRCPHRVISGRNLPHIAPWAVAKARRDDIRLNGAAFWPD